MEKYFSLFLENCKKNNVPYNSIKSYFIDLKNFDFVAKEKKIKWEEITEGEVKSVLKLKHGTIRRMFFTLKKFFKFLEKEKNIDNPFKEYKVKSPIDSKMKIMSIRDVVELLSYFETDKAKKMRFYLRNKAIIYLLVYTGCSASELLKCRLSDLSVWEQCLTVGKQKVLLYKIWDTITPLLEGRKDDELIFNGLSYWGLSAILKQCLKNAGIDTNYSLKSIRHFFAKNIVSNGAEKLKVQEYLKISRISVLKYYE